MINKQEIIKEFKKSESDTGSCGVQVALLTGRINHLTEHFKIHKKDFHSRRGLYKLIGQRKRLLRYIKNNNIEEYRELINKLNLRK